MQHDELDSLVKRLKGGPLFDDSGPTQKVALDRDEICKLIPHREPFLLLDFIRGLDIPRRLIRGGRRIDPDDPVFAGHFPNAPVYPGVLQVEAMGQLSLCLNRLGGVAEAGGDRLANPRAIHIHHASFLDAVLPGDTIDIHAALVEETELTAIGVGQIYNGPKLCAYAVQEVYFVE